MTDPVLEALWKKVIDAWDDDERHGAFIEYCRSKNQLLEAAVRYRGMAGDHTRGPIAQRRLQGIATLAMASLELERVPERSRATTLLRVFAILLFALGSAALLYLLGR